MLRAVQGATKSPLQLTWTDAAGAAVNLTGATITARMTRDRVTVRDVTGTFALVTAASGVFSWDFSTADLATPGVWEVQFTADIGGEDIRTFSVLIAIERAL